MFQEVGDPPVSPGKISCRHDYVDRIIESFLKGTVELGSTPNKSLSFFSRYTFRVSKDTAAINSPIGLVKAIDGDAKRNGRITYSLEDDSSNFGIYPNSGAIYLKELGSGTTTLRVIAKDQGQPSLQTEVDVDVIVTETGASHAGQAGPQFAQWVTFEFADAFL